MNTHKAVTLRLPPELYHTSRRIAQERRVSLNVLIREGLQSLVRSEQNRRLYDDFTLLGQDAEATEAEFAFEAQREVVLREAGADAA